VTSTLEAASASARNVYPPGTVLLPCHDHARYHHFTNDMILLDVPDGTEISVNRSASIVQNLNMGIAGLPESSDWVWIIGDDHTFARDIIMRLLTHLYDVPEEQQVDIVAPLCVRRGPPFSLVAFDAQVKIDEVPHPAYHSVQFQDLPQHGLVEVVACGSAGMLVRRKVFDAIGSPWFANSTGLFVDEDMEFCRRARAKGFKVYLDVDNAIGHLGILAAWPRKVDGEWGLILDFQGQGDNRIFMPGGIRTEEVKPGDTQQHYGVYGDPKGNFTVHDGGRT